MDLGVCGGWERAEAAKAAGFDFLEGTVGGVLAPGQPEAVFAEARARLRDLPLPMPAVNCFLPKHYPVVGPSVNVEALDTYVRTVFGRAREAGIGIIVFGSGGARRVAEGFDPAEARRQFTAFAARVAPWAAEAGVTLALEPLNRKECNLLNSVSDGAAIVREVNHPGFRLLADAYHMMMDGEPWSAVEDNADLIVHAHVATVPGRRTPGAEPCDQLAGFFAALRDQGYEGRVSFEGKVEDEAGELPEALRLMRTWAEG